MAGAKEKIKAAGSDLLDSTQLKLAGKVFRVNGKKYKARRLIAEGGFGYVYLVEDELTGQLRALKHMIMQTRESRESTLREIALHSSLPNSPFIVPLLGSEVVKGPPDEAFVVMELCSGGNLADVINVAGPGGRGLSETRIWEIFFQVCQAVAILHEQTPIVIHRDIKAENVLISEDGRYKLCDFGSAKREMVFPSSDSVRNEIQEDIDRFTTMVYRSPEMVDLYMEKWIGDKADVWALGCLLFKMAYVVTPFEEAGRLGILNARVEFPQTLSSASYSEDLRATIKWLLTADPEERPNIYDVLERCAKYARTSWSRGSKVPPQHPPDPQGFGSAVHAPAASAPSHNSSSAFFNSLSWVSTDGSQTHQARTQTPDSFFGSPSPNDFFSSPASSTPIQFASSDTSDSSAGWAAFESTPVATSAASHAPSFDVAFDLPQHASTGQTHSAADPNYSKSRHVQFNVAADPFAAPTHHAPAANSRLAPPGASGGSSRSHRRSVSDSSALTASLAVMQLNGESGGQFTASAKGPIAPDISRLPPLVASVMASAGTSKVPSLAVVRELLTYTWANPRQAHVSRIFQALAPKLSESPLVTLKGLYLVHRLVSEGSDLVLTLCGNKLEFFKQVATQAALVEEQHPLRSACVQYAQYLVKKLEFHQAFEGCFEGSYSLDVYFQRLRTEGKKLQIGAADSPFRRQAVPALLELQTLALALLEQLLQAAPNHPDASSLKLHCAIPAVSDLCAILLLLQYVTTKLLATKTDFSKAIAQYEENYSRMLKIFAKFASISTSPLSHGFPVTETAWAQGIKLPTLAATAPAIVKGSTAVSSPPSLDPTLAANSQTFSNAIIFDPLTEAETREATWVWSNLVLQANLADSNAPAPVASPLSHSAHIPNTLGLQSNGSDPTLYRSSDNTSGFNSPSFTPSTSFGVSSAVPHAFTPPPVFVTPVATPTSTTTGSSFDPFSANPASAPSLSLSASGGFAQGDPFLFSSASRSDSGDFSAQAFGANDFGSASFASPAGDFGGFLVPSTTHASSTPPTNAAAWDDSGFGTEPFRPTLSVSQQQPPRRQLAASADPSPISQPVSGTRIQTTAAKGHKKRPSDGAAVRSAGAASGHSSKSSHQHAYSTGSSMVSSGSDGTLTSEEKLKNKDQLSAQVAEFTVIQEKKGNNVCFDCGDVVPKWISLNLGVFICYRCSGVHRSFGTHISKVRSVELDVLTQEQIDFFKRMGNRRAAKIWLANVPEDRVLPDRNTAQLDLERFLRDKYVFEEFKATGDQSESSSISSSSSSKKKHTRNMSHH